MSGAYFDLSKRRRLDPRRLPPGDNHPLAAWRASLRPAGTGRAGKGRVARHGGNDQARSDALRAGTPPGAHLAELRSALSQGLGGAGCPELYQGQPRRVALVPLVVPHGHLRELRSEEHTSELQSRPHLVCRLLLEKKKIGTRIIFVNDIVHNATDIWAAPSAILAWSTSPLSHYCRLGGNIWNLNEYDSQCSSTVSL